MNGPQNLQKAHLLHLVPGELPLLFLYTQLLLLLLWGPVNSPLQPEAAARLFCNFGMDIGSLSHVLISDAQILQQPDCASVPKASAVDLISLLFFVHIGVYWLSAQHTWSFYVAQGTVNSTTRAMWCEDDQIMRSGHNDLESQWSRSTYSLYSHAPRSWPIFDLNDWKVLGFAPVLMKLIVHADLGWRWGKVF